MGGGDVKQVYALTMPRPRHRSLRDIALESNRWERFYAAAYDKPGPPALVPVPKRERKPPDPNAPPMEREVLRAVLKYLAHHPKVAWCCRVNSGMLQLDDDRFVRFNSKRGMADIIGQMVDGRFLACETKREGAQLLSHQRDFLNEVRSNKGVAFVARSLDDAQRELQSA